MKHRGKQHGRTSVESLISAPMRLWSVLRACYGLLASISIGVSPRSSRVETCDVLSHTEWMCSLFPVLDSKHLLSLWLAARYIAHMAVCYDYCCKYINFHPGNHILWNTTFLLFVGLLGVSLSVFFFPSSLLQGLTLMERTERLLTPYLLSFPVNSKRQVENLVYFLPSDSPAWVFLFFSFLTFTCG